LKRENEKKQDEIIRTYSKIKNISGGNGVGTDSRKA